VDRRQDRRHLRDRRARRAQVRRRPDPCPYLDDLARTLDCAAELDNPQGHIMGERFARTYTDPANWNDITDRMEARRTA
jgi:hypothetical protein